MLCHWGLVFALMVGKEFGNLWKRLETSWKPFGNNWKLLGNVWNLLGNLWKLLENSWKLSGCYCLSGFCGGLVCRRHGGRSFTSRRAAWDFLYPQPLLHPFPHGGRRRFAVLKETRSVHCTVLGHQGRESLPSVSCQYTMLQKQRKRMPGGHPQSQPSF